MISKEDITAELAAKLVASQFPEWADLPVTPVELNGWDNTTFRLGDDKSVRLPIGEAYALAVEKEHRWLPVLAPRLPLPIPRPLALGSPDDRYPWPWSVYEWLQGEPATVERVADLGALAKDLAGFLTALYSVDTTDGPASDLHCFFRGGPLSVWDEMTRRAISELGDEIDALGALATWEAAVAAAFDGSAVWFHGDVSASNLLVADGRLRAVIDFGTTGVGDPACDLPIAWTLFADDSRSAFRNELSLDAATWTRGRGWALWKALITMQQARHQEGGAEERFGWRWSSARVIDEVVAEHQQTT
ncbi:MAG TPA: aminoglycoside phosphotransferase family protein [Acidimicrobiales bacterium]|nr:aminoglycoside phosphotransferase family protein [Acidimicrobiales bacterium]